MNRRVKQVVSRVPGKDAVRSAAYRLRVRAVQRELASVIPDGPDRTVVVLVPGNRLELLDAWWPLFEGDAVHVIIDRKIPRADIPPNAASIKVAPQPPQIRSAIEQNIGFVDLVADLRWCNPGRAAETWAQTSSTLRDGGAYVLCPPDLAPSRTRAAMLATAAVLGSAPEVTFDGRPVAPPKTVDPDVLGLALVVDGGAALVKQRTRFRYLRDQDLATTITREPAVTMRVLEELPAGTLVTDAPIVSHTSTKPVGALAGELPWPRLQLRHYEGRIDFFKNTLLVAGQSILPDSHRFYRRANNAHPLHPLLSGLPGRSDVALVPAAGRTKRPVLEGTYYLLDPQITQHFGHIVTEVVPRLWGWDRAKGLYPGLKALTSVRRGEDTDPIVHRLLTAYGIAPEDIVFVDRPVQLESVVTANAMWHNFAPHFTHPDVRTIWDRIADGLMDPSAPTWDRLFLTRAPGGYRTVHNVAEVEAVFRDHGFEVLRPEEYDLGVQAGIFRHAKVVAGFGGSAMFNLMYNHGLEHMIVLNQEAFSARNEHLYAALLGAREDWFWSKPDTPDFHSNWTFDMDRNRADLERVLANYR